MDHDAPKRYTSFAEFYPFYLSQHQHRTCRLLHVIGTSIVIALVGAFVVSRRPQFLALAPLAGYGLAWVGHFFFEKNRPATFSYPLYSLIGDFVMWKDIVTGRLR